MRRLSFLKISTFASGAALVFGMVILALSLLAASNPMKVYPFDQTASGSGEAPLIVKNDYYLPYPGVLPDSPLYKLKALRDIVTLWLTFNPEKKAEKELAYADKRLNAAIALVEGGKASLGVSTATKGEKYLEQSVSGAVALHDQGQDDKSLLLTLAKATDKHVLVLTDLTSKVSGSDKMMLEQYLKTTLILRDKVNQALREG